MGNKNEGAKKGFGIPFLDIVCYTLEVSVTGVIYVCL